MELRDTRWTEGGQMGPAARHAVRAYLNGKYTFLATYENCEICRYFPRKSPRCKYASVGEWRMGRHGEGQRDGTGRRGTGLDGKGTGQEGEGQNGVIGGGTVWDRGGGGTGSRSQT